MDPSMIIDAVERFRKLDFLAARMTDEERTEIIRQAHPRIGDGGILIRLRRMKELDARAMYASNFTDQAIRMTLLTWMERELAQHPERWESL